jgi:CRISPR-associated protein Cmr5
MPLQNLEQIRAKHALAFANSPAQMRGKDGGEAIKKIPPMIMGNGLLAAIAFAIEERQKGPVRPGFASIFDAIARHLSSAEIDILTNVKDARGMIKALTESDSQILKLATSESLEWLGYARRFVTGGDDNNSQEHDE